MQDVLFYLAGGHLLFIKNVSNVVYFLPTVRASEQEWRARSLVEARRRGLRHGPSYQHAVHTATASATLYGAHS
jgi:hypothetical protein